MWNSKLLENYEPPVANVDWAQSLLEDPRIVRNISKVQRIYDEPFMHQYSATLNWDGVKVVGEPTVSSAGCAFDNSVALMKVAGEAAERFSLAKTPDGPLAVGTFRECSPNLDPNLFAYFSDQQLATEKFKGFRWSPQSPFSWVEGENLVDGRFVRIPAQLVYVPYEVGAFGAESYIFPCTTTGAAAGRNDEESSLSGMLEIFERDAFMIYYLNRTAGLRIIVGNDPLFREIEDYLSRFKLSLQIFYLPTDAPVCTVLALVVDEAETPVPAPWLSAGMKCSFEPKRAVLGAIEEALQTRPWVRQFLQEIHLGKDGHSLLKNCDIIMDRALYWSDPTRAEQLSFLLDSPRTIRFEEVCKFGLSTDKSRMEAVLEYCCKEGHPVFRVDLTPPEVREHGLVVSKIVMPTLQQFYLAEPYIPLKVSRWRDIPHRLGLEDGIPPEPNPVPHFFL